MNRLKTKYNEIISKNLMKEFKYANIMLTPKIQKVVINAGVGPFRENREAVESFIADLTAITGQKPTARQARLSIASFKVRQNDVVGYTVTLRGDRLWAFLDKFINVALPRVRDFRGLNPDAFDENGNYSTGIREHVIFPEVNPNTTKGIRSLQITVVFNTKDKNENRFLLKELGIPFADERSRQAQKIYG
jgi:large subunit ribosomal protein L5